MKLRQKFALQKIRKFPISAEMQLSASAARFNCTSCKSAPQISKALSAPQISTSCKSALICVHKTNISKTNSAKSLVIKSGPVNKAVIGEGFFNALNADGKDKFNMEVGKLYRPKYMPRENPSGQSAKSR